MIPAKNKKRNTLISAMHANIHRHMTMFMDTQSETEHCNIVQLSNTALLFENN